MWLTVMKALQEHLAKAKIADEVRLGGYNVKDIRPELNGKGLIFILRNNERPIDPNNLVNDTEINLSIHCWLVEDVGADILKRYEAINALEKKVIRALDQYRDSVLNITDEIQLINLTVTDVAGDGDSNHPLIGCGISVTIVAYERS